MNENEVIAVLFLLLLIFMPLTIFSFLYDVKPPIDFRETVVWFLVSLSASIVCDSIAIKLAVG